MSIADAWLGHRARGSLRRFLEISGVGAILGSWLGLGEALMLWSSRSIPEPTQLLHDTVIGYAGLGLLVGLCWGSFCELVTSRRGLLLRRRRFYLISIAILILLFQATVQAHARLGHGVQPVPPGSATSLVIIVVGALLAIATLRSAWVLCRAKSEHSSPDPIVSLRAALVSALPLLLAGSLPWLTSLAPSPPPPDLPNVLLIVMDTTRVDRLSSYGYERATTPQLDRLASEGLLFTRAYSASPWTFPSHASLFTAQYPAVHQATREQHRLDETFPTLAEHLGERGLFPVAFAAKSWLRYELGVMRGFERYFDMTLQTTTSLEAIERFLLYWLDKRSGGTDKGARVINRSFMNYIERHADERFFAFINYNEAHAGYAPPSPFRERFLLSEPDSAWGLTKHVDTVGYLIGEEHYSPRDMEIFDDLYDGAVAYQDHRMGELFDYLRDRSILDETLVIITADHGENIGEHQLMGHEFSLHDTLLHVPLIVRLPGIVPAGVSSDIPVENRLIWPMIENVLAAWQSRSPIGVERLASSLKESSDRGDPILSELYRRNLTKARWQLLEREKREDYERRLRSLYVDGMKYIRGSEGRDELYDLRLDPNEQNDLAGERPDEVRRLRELLEAKITALEPPEAGGPVELSEKLLEELRELGYVD